MRRLKGAIAIVAVALLAAACSAAGADTPAASRASCASPSYDGTTFKQTCTIPQATRTVPGPTTTVTATATTTVTATVTAPPSSASSSPSSSPSSSSSTPPPPPAFPTAATTGVPAGTTLTPSGGLNVTTAGAVINGLDVSGCIDVSAPNVTIENTRVRGACTYVIESESTGLVIKDTEVDGQGAAGAAVGIGYAGFTALRVNVHGTQDGINANGDAVVQDSYIWGLKSINGSHNDGIQVTEGSNDVFEHDTILNPNDEASAVMIGGDQGDVSNVTLDDSEVAGGDYAVYGGADPPAGNTVTGITITNNEFSTQYFPACGSFGPTNAIIPGQVFTGNKWLDGPNAGQPVS